ncbi:DNA-3-methyladenine glycosylase 2 family protein [Mycobacterium sp. CBMA271]|uniref:DNA-3-methyladenine glycosylase 2 family protein n=1 Tax=unclassified Mycobacteroides TaxID=2618759 RepID=UPI0012DBD0C1|nr:MULTISPECIES: Ada metal-binding domain-containing protein [unclassified Mycobacteroides]MUM17752.1 DNA-3-methyladenine glycosylase [Mycobacteroides sp. CBMA 326]MUM22973.1 DNA-3-methyladenine glycosylase 2 family protein [Mycobacteroides sp. CBMA 271]
MELDAEACYRAVQSRDTRFDGQFYTAVRTTGIYCRPSCPAITPKPQNVSFHPTAASAQAAGYRACRRCLPDAAPGSPLWNLKSDLAVRAMRLIGDGMVERDGVDGLSRALGYSSRQLNRVLLAELGAGPLALARANRATTARLLIQRTDLSMSDIAFAAGFSSIRQFNETIAAVFATTPSKLRTELPRSGSAASAPVPGAVSLKLPLRQPHNVSWSTWLLEHHCARGVEEFSDGRYTRALRMPHGAVIVTLTVAEDQVRADLQLTDMRDLAPTVARLRHLLDLDADPAAVDEALRIHPALARLVDEAPGCRVPGSVDGAELLLRTMIGQQISVAAANTATAALVAALGDQVTDTTGRVTHLFPLPEAVAELGATVLAGPGARIEAVVGAAERLATGKLELHHGMTATELRRQLLDIKGIGPWTADYVVMRQLADPDVLLEHDLVLRKGAEAEGIDITAARGWSPWRSYVSMHLWRKGIAAQSRPRTRKPKGNS